MEKSSPLGTLSSFIKGQSITFVTFEENNHFDKFSNWFVNLTISSTKYLQKTLGELTQHTVIFSSLVMYWSFRLLRIFLIVFLRVFKWTLRESIRMIKLMSKIIYKVTLWTFETTFEFISLTLQLTFGVVFGILSLISESSSDSGNSSKRKRRIITVRGTNKNNVNQVIGHWDIKDGRGEYREEDVDGITRVTKTFTEKEY